MELLLAVVSTADNAFKAFVTRGMQAAKYTLIASLVLVSVCIMTFYKISPR